MIVQNSAGGQSSVMIDTAATRVFRLKKGVMTTARLVNDRLRVQPVRWVPLMVTLTYKDAKAWRPDHISQFMDRINQFAKRRGLKLPYVWVAELQERGAVHYHVLLWIPARLRLPKADRRGWWSHGMTNTKRVRNGVGYVAKYASKFESKGGEFPKGLRLHGVGGLTSWEKRVVAWWKLPKDLRHGEEGSCVWRRAVGGGWLNPESGERLLPQWEVERGGSWRFVRVSPTTKSEAERTWLTYWRETNADRKASQVQNPMIKCDVTDYLEERSNQLNEAYADRLWRECQSRLEDWRAQLSADRAQWIASVERQHGLSPESCTTGQESSPVDQLRATRLQRRAPLMWRALSDVI